MIDAQLATVAAPESSRTGAGSEATSVGASFTGVTVMVNVCGSEVSMPPLAVPPLSRTVMENSAGGSTPDLQGAMQFFDITTIGKYVQELYLGSKTPKEVLQAIDADRQKMFDVVGQ